VVRIAPARAAATKVQASGTSVHLKRRHLMDFTSRFTVLNLRRDSFGSGSPGDNMRGHRGAKLERILVRMKRVVGNDAPTCFNVTEIPS
jgi:hypothetical protein